MFTAGTGEFRPAYAGMVVDGTETIEITRTNTSNRYVATGTADATAGGLYAAGTLTGKVLSLGVAGGALSSLTLANPGNVATQAAFLAAIKAKSEWAGINAQIGGPNGNQLVLSHPLGITIDVNGTSTANAVLGLTAGVVASQSIIAIDFGVAVAAASYGSNLDEFFCQAPSLDSDIITGLSIRDTMARPVGTDRKVDYAAAYPVRIMRLGFMWVYAAEAVKQGDTVCSITQGNSMVALNGALGSIATTAAGVGRVALDGTNGNIKATWETTRTAGQLGKVWVR